MSVETDICIYCRQNTQVGQMMYFDFSINDVQVDSIRLRIILMLFIACVHSQLPEPTSCVYFDEAKFFFYSFFFFKF